MIRPGSPADLPDVLEVVALRAEHFVPAAHPIIADDYRQFSSFVWEEEGKVKGFIVYLMNALEVELLWLAVRRDVRGRGVGAKLMKQAINAGVPRRIAILKTGSPTSKIPGTSFDGTKYARTINFFKRLGFKEACVVNGYWGPTNDCVIMYCLMDAQPGGNHEPLENGLT